MSNELVKVELYGENNAGDKRLYTVASGTAIDKGTLLTLSDARTAAACTASGAMCAGVAAMDKSGTDFSTEISAWTNGIFEAIASGAISAGQPVMTASDANFPNTVKTYAPYPYAGNASGAGCIGYALETATDAEKVNIRLML